MVIWHLFQRKLLLWWYLWKQRVIERVMIGFMVRARVRIKIRIKVRVGICLTLAFSLEQMLYILKDSHDKFIADPRFHFVMLYRWMRIEWVQGESAEYKSWTVSLDLHWTQSHVRLPVKPGRSSQARWRMERNWGSHQWNASPMGKRTIWKFERWPWTCIGPKAVVACLLNPLSAWKGIKAVIIEMLASMPQTR